MNHLAATTAVAASILTLAGTTAAMPFDVPGPAVDDVDTSPATVVPLNVAETGSITDINVELLLCDGAEGPGCFGQYTDNLDITLSHNSIDVLLYAGNGDTQDAYIDAVFDDAAAALAPTSGTVDGTFLPVAPLSAFNGQELSGLWELTIFDDTITGDGTALVAWRIFGTTADVPAPATVTLAVLGIAAMGFGTRKRRKT